MRLRRMLLGALVAAFGWAGAGADTDPLEPRPARSREGPRASAPATPEGAAAPGFRAEGPSFYVFAESRRELDDWVRELSPPPVGRPVVCGVCGRVRLRDDLWRRPSHLLRHADASHGLCPPCARTHFPDLLRDA